jgi:hypothetical protein
VKRVNEIEVAVKEIKSLPTAIDANTHSGPTFAEIVKKTEENLIKSVKINIDQAITKVNRVIVFNLAPSEDDQELVGQLLDSIKFDKTKIT